VPIYLDHNATTPVHPEVLDAMLPYLREHHGNPSSAHAYGRTARAAVDRARAQVAALIGAAADEVVFTAGGTEATNLALHGVLAGAPRRGLVTTVAEHPATAEVVTCLEGQGARVTRVPLAATGLVDLAALAAALDADTALVTILHAHNETGAVQPAAAIGALVRACGARFHLDVAQSLGKLPIHVDLLRVDLLSIAGHKLYAPKGVGALYLRRGLDLVPLLRGAGHERGRRPGTENVPGVVGLGAACELASRDLAALADRLAGQRERLWHRLRADIPGLARSVAPAHALPNTLHLRFPDVDGPALLAAAPAVAASTASACHDGHAVAPAVLLAMGVPAADARGAVRLSLGRGTTDADLDHAAAALVRAWHAVRGPGTSAPGRCLDLAGEPRCSDEGSSGS
jgi:cysteine desulfurase